MTAPPRRKLSLATTSLAGCFGCHMSLLDIDERLFELVELYDLRRSPLDDLKSAVVAAFAAVSQVEGQMILRRRRYAQGMKEGPVLA